jgi:Uma2 family endonuclease
MATGLPTALPADWTVADMLEHLSIPPERVRLHPPPGQAREEDVLETHRRTGRLCELVDGILVEKTVGYYESVLAGILLHFVNAYLAKHPLGLAAGEAGMLKVLPGQVRIPDVSFVRWERFPGGKPSRNDPIPAVSPDLAVEILSEGNTEPEMERKLREYFEGGSRLVWLIDPEDRRARVYSSPGQFTTRSENDILDGGDVLPGFQFRLGDLFLRARQHAAE